MEFRFSDNIAAEVARRVDALRELQVQTNAWLEGVMQATADANGVGNHRVMLNPQMNGIVIADEAKADAVNETAQKIIDWEQSEIEKRGAAQK